MDPVQPDQQQKKLQKKLLFEIVLTAIVLVVLLGFLNFFNILPLSSTFPNILGFLPKKMDQGSQITSTQISSSTLSAKISCPSMPEFCQTENGVIIEGKYIGWGAVLASGSAIFAAFDGILSSTEETFTKVKNEKTSQKKFVTLYLDNSDLGLRATYYFRGSAPKDGRVTKGTQIAISNGKTISIYDKKSLVFSVISGYPDKNNLVFLNKDSFEQQ